MVTYEGVQGILCQEGVDRLVVKVIYHLVTYHRVIGCTAFDEFRQKPRRRMVEEVGIRDMLARLVRLDDDASDHEGSTAEFEEVIGSSDFLKAQY